MTTTPRARRSLAVPAFLAGLVAGLALSHGHGLAYVYAAQKNVQRVMRFFEREIDREIENLPAEHQIVTEFATRRALERAFAENDRHGFWSALRAAGQSSGWQELQGSEPGAE